MASKYSLQLSFLTGAYGRKHHHRGTLAVTQYAKEGTEDRDIIEKFCIEYINLLEEDSSILDRTDFKESFSLLINEIGMNTLTNTEEGDTLWSILLDCWTSYGTQHNYSKGGSKRLTTQ